jgi:hypothetical protein
MSISEWTELSSITDRVGDLKSKGNAAAAAGDFDTANYFFRLAKQAEEARERVVKRLIGDVSGAI